MLLALLPNLLLPLLAAVCEALIPKDHILLQQALVREEDLSRLWADTVEPAFRRSTARRRNATAMRALAKQVGYSPTGAFVRLVAIYDFFRWTRARGLTRPRRLLKLSPDDPELHLLQPESTEMWVHGYNMGADGVAGDLHQPVPFRDVDMVLLCDTLEHLYDPLLALLHLREALARGGYLWVTVPTNVVPHMTPWHFGQFTLMGLGALLLRAGFTVEEAGQWGSRENEVLMFSRLHERVEAGAGKLRGGPWPGYGELRNLLGDEGWQALLSGRRQFGIENRRGF